MVLDYNKWNAIIEEVDNEDEKGWADMRPRERQEAIICAEEKEKLIDTNRKDHAAYLKEIDCAADTKDYNACWMYDVDISSYEDFTLKRTSRVVKPRGAEFFRAKMYPQAEQQWLGGLELVKKVGLSWPTASELYMQLKCNLAQLYIKSERWDEAQSVTDDALALDPDCEKALYRRALVRMHYSDWVGAKRDLTRLMKSHPQNAEAVRLLAEVHHAIRRGQEQLKGKGVKLSNAVEDIGCNGMLRKLHIIVHGNPQPSEVCWTWPWSVDEWLGPCLEKAVLTAHIVVCSVAGQELFNTRSCTRLPETPEERDELRRVMREIALLDDISGKLPRRTEEFCQRELGWPLRWRYGDPGLYAGFELASRSMMLGEKALFEIDQPLLEPSVHDFYRTRGGASHVAGLPDLKYHVNEKSLNLLAEELPEWELDLESKVHRTVRAEIELLDLALYHDLSLDLCGGHLVLLRARAV